MAQTNADARDAATSSQRAVGASVPLFVDVDETLLSMQDVVGRKWIPVIVYHLLADGPKGFSALKDDVDGISSKMLSESLDELESAGLITRELISDRPVRVEYDLTDAGQDMEPLVAEMVRWGTEHDETSDEDGDEQSPIADGTLPTSERPQSPRVSPGDS